MASHLSPRRSLLPFLALAGVAAVAAMALTGRRSSGPQLARSGPQDAPYGPAADADRVPSGAPAAAQRPNQPAAVSDRTVAASGEPQGGQYVRPAGPEAMRDPPSTWDAADEGSDESFPASDSPAKY